MQNQIQQLAKMVRDNSGQLGITVRQQTEHTNKWTNYEPWLQQLADTELTANNWTTIYHTSDAILLQMRKIAAKYNEYRQQNPDKNEDKHWKPKSIFDLLGDAIRSFTDALSTGKSIKNLTVDKYNSTIADTAAATTALRNITATVHDITGTVRNIQAIVDGIKAQWNTEKQTITDTITKMKAFKQDGQAEIQDLTAKITEITDNMPIPKMCLRRNDILP